MRIAAVLAADQAAYEVRCASDGGASADLNRKPASGRGALIV
jgi:hypothetical protein